jgi:hypothetical protein
MLGQVRQDGGAWRFREQLAAALVTGRAQGAAQAPARKPWQVLV